MTILGKLNQSLVLQPAWASHTPQLASAPAAARDVFSSVSRAAGRMVDALFCPLAQRPVAKLCNDVMGTRIAHDSYVDIVLHAAWIAICAATCASAAGVAFGLSVAAVDSLSLLGMIAWHVGSNNGLLRPFFD